MLTQTFSQLEDSLQASAQDLKYASSTLQADLDRFQRQKVEDLRQLTIQLARVHREWCRQVSSSTRVAYIFGLPGTVEPRGMASGSSCYP